MAMPASSLAEYAILYTDYNLWIRRDRNIIKHAKNRCEQARELKKMWRTHKTVRRVNNVRFTFHQTFNRISYRFLRVSIYAA